MEKTPQQSVFLLGSIFPTDTFPLRASAIFPVLDHFDEQVTLARMFVPGVELKSPARVRATAIACYQRTFETIFNQVHGFSVQLVFLDTQTEFKFARRHRFGRDYEHFVNDGSIGFRRVEWPEFVLLANAYFVKAGRKMNIEHFLDQSLNVALAEARWSWRDPHIE